MSDDNKLEPFRLQIRHLIGQKKARIAQCELDVERLAVRVEELRAAKSDLEDLLDDSLAEEGTK